MTKEYFARNGNESSLKVHEMLYWARLVVSSIQHPISKSDNQKLSEKSLNLLTKPTVQLDKQAEVE